MNVLNVLFFMLLGSFSIGHANTVQISDVKEIFSQTTDKNQCAHIKAIIFDCDGTLIDNGIGYFLDWQHALKCQGFELNADEFWDFMHKNRLVGSPGADEVIVKYCCELLGRECANEIMKDKKAFSAKLHQTYEFPAIEPTVNFLHALGKEKEYLGLKLGLASANSKENVLRVLKRLNVDQCFDVIVSGDDLAEYSDPEGTNKPTGLVDDITISVIPVVLGSGIPLFSTMNREHKCRLISSQSYPSGLVQLKYEVIK